MTPLDYFLNNIEQVYKDRRTGQEFDDLEEVKQFCVTQTNNVEVKQSSLR